MKYLKLRLLTIFLLAVSASFTGRDAWAQAPRINTLFPIGGKAGSSVEVEIRGSNLDGANVLMVHGQGVSGTVAPGGSKVDEANKPVWQAKCGSCHELRSPGNRSMTPSQWAATVERMVKDRAAPLSAAEAEKVTQYLVSYARAGRVTAQIKIAADTVPGIYEIRVVTSRGVSTACPFEVGNLPEVVGTNGKRELAQKVTLPCVVNGSITGNAERHYFRFTAKKGERLVFNLKAFRYNEQTQMYFNPDLRLYDASGKRLAENHGYYDLDPLIDWNCPEEGEYTLEVRDILGRGNPGDVYRMSMGAMPYDTVLYPPAAKPGSKTTVYFEGKNTAGMPTTASLTPPQNLFGVTTINSIWGPQPLYVSPYPVFTETTKTAALPATFAGRIAGAGAITTYSVQGSGDFEFEIFASRLGSPAHPRLTLLRADGRGIANTAGEGRTRAHLDEGKPYTLKVEDETGQGGSDYVYAIEARPTHPIIEVVARPANLTLRPGLASTIEVLLTRREGVEGDVVISAVGLPAGVTVTPNVIQPDRNQCWLVLTAAPNAAPIEKPFTIRATAHGPQGEIEIPVQPQETYLMNNQPHPINRAECVVAVRGTADFTATLETQGTIKVHPKKGVPVGVKIERRKGFNGNVTVRISNLPRGWVANQETIGGDKSEVMLLVRPDGNDTRPFLTRDPKWTPLWAVVEAYSDEFPFVVGTLRVDKADRTDDE